MSIAFLTFSKKLVDKGRIPSNFTYRMMLIRPREFSTKRLSCFERFSIPSSKISPNCNGKRISFNLSNGTVVRHESKVEGSQNKLEDFELDDFAKIHSSINNIVESQIFLKRRIERQQTKLLVMLNYWYLI